MSKDWYIFGNQDQDKRDIERRGGPPPWRSFNNPRRRFDYQFIVSDVEIALVNAALRLRRPLLISGQPGTGKSSLAYAVADQLGLDDVLVWPITSKSTLRDALYRYDAIGRLQATNLHKDEATPPIGDYLSLGPLGTALADSAKKPRVLLIDEIDKSDIDLPSDLLHIFEEGEFEIPELERLAKEEPIAAIRKHKSQDVVNISEGFVKCEEFPFVVVTSNGERELPGPFLRRCLSLHIEIPNKGKLRRIVKSHFTQLIDDKAPQWEIIDQYIEQIVERRSRNEYVATDQLLNAIHLVLSSVEMDTSFSDDDEQYLRDFILQAISSMGTR